ncbi:MAG TPA: ferrous iron transport protein A [Thermoplasmatales archaeon]|nr:FeoA family protein [Candidatus Thermoplasmatota archaeon]HDS59475.1 ferrous iron transport protein A [Thermoplasmatales archaeon]
MSSPVPLSHLAPGSKGIVAAIEGGGGFTANLRARGIREGKNIEVVTAHPLRGPLVVRIDGRETTIGRGMAHKIMVQARNV